jgi:transcriptional regulator GlxA family with amidase domain
MRDDPAKGQLVAMLVADGLSLFEFGVACEVFGDDRSDLGVPWYRFGICAERPGLVSTPYGLRVEATSGLGLLQRAGTVIVPPIESTVVSQTALQAIRRCHARGARIVSLCTGAFVLAAAGLLDGRLVTTHWGEAAELARRYPSVRVDPGVLYVDDGDILTSAGSAASIDLCLHLVRSDFGADVAVQVARDMVVPPHRDGGQAQYIESPVRAPAPGIDPFDAALTWAEGHLDEIIAIEDLAGRAAMSPRTFARRFRASTGTTPYQWLLRQRIAAAQRLLETGDSPVDLIASRTGFGTGTNLRKHFQRVVRTSPQAYRRAFQERRAG